MLLPKELRDRISLGDDVIIAGGIRYFEIWDRQRFEQQALPEADEFYLAESPNFLNTDFEPMEGEA